MENLIVLTPAWSSMKEPQKWVPTMKSQGAAKNEANNAAQETNTVEKIDFFQSKS